MVPREINRGRHTDHPAGRHSIQINQCPPPPHSVKMQQKLQITHKTNTTLPDNFRLFLNFQLSRDVHTANKFSGEICHRLTELSTVRASHLEVGRLLAELVQVTDGPLHDAQLRLCSAQPRVKPIDTSIKRLQLMTSSVQQPQTTAAFRLHLTRYGVQAINRRPITQSSFSSKCTAAHMSGRAVYQHAALCIRCPLHVCMYHSGRGPAYSGPIC